MQPRITLYTVLLIALLPISPDLHAQIPVPSDSAKIDSVGADTTDSKKLDSPEKRMADMQKRLQEFKESEKPPPRLSFYDSLLTYVVSERFNLRSQMDQSYFHDAGDYFKFNPAYFVVDYQSTPMRKTVQPFGLTGNRLNVILGGMPFTPFEHVIEPDGMIDMNDVPTALDGSVYIIPGSAGDIFGGNGNLSTLLSVPAVADSSKPTSSFMADRGYFGYAFVRGKYARDFSNGRKIQLSASSRKTDGLAFGRDDEQLHYTGGGYFPVGRNFGFGIDGKLYDRDAALVIRPDVGGALVKRHRFDRSFYAFVDRQNEQRSIRNEVGFRHLRQGSYLDNIYKGRFNNTVNGVGFSHERLFDSKMLKAEATLDFSDYDNGIENHDKLNASAGVYLSTLEKTNNISLMAKAGYSDDFEFLPAAAMIYKIEHEKVLVQFSVGFSRREPTQHQLYLPFQQKSLYGSTTKDYSESGNPNLKKESQLIGSLTIEPGTIDNHLTLSVTGGKITDAIEWSFEKQSGTIEVIHFSPVNENITFATVSVGPKFRLSDNLHFSAGGAYHYYHYDSLGERPYQPEYNYFSGLELHYYWKDRLVHLYAYGELAYNGPYHGYEKQNLGKELVANAKLTLGLSNFRFYFIFQNTLDNDYEAREYMSIPGRFFYYGLTWNFFD